MQDIILKSFEGSCFITMMNEKHLFRLFQGVGYRNGDA